MSGDLVSLRILLVGAASVQQRLWREAVTQASLPIEFESVAAAAAKAALGGGVDICVLDAALDGGETASVIGAARAKRPAPLVFASIPSGGVRPGSIDGELPVVADAAAARKAVEICVRTKMPTAVLLAADSGSLRGVVRKILGASRFELDVHEASNGVDTLERLGTGRFNLVFLDSDMPGVDGVDILQGIKRTRPDAAVIVMSSALERGAAGRPQPAEALAFLRKPFYPDDVDAVLQRYFGLGDPR